MRSLARGFIAGFALVFSSVVGAQWTDTKTGNPVVSAPIITDPKTGKTDWVRPSADNRDYAYDDRTGRNFYYDRSDCRWKDTKTGKPVVSAPIITDPRTGKTDWVRPSADNRDYAYDDRTERNFARDCPPLQQAKRTPPQPPGGSVGQAPVLDKVSEQALALHNKLRAEVGSPPLQWDPELAAAAADYARQRASGASYGHAARAGREESRENLSMGRLGETPVQMMQLWLREKANFKPGIFPDISTTGDWSKAGHYSQMVWAGTTHVGCGTATGAQWSYLVCRYSPPGNQDGKPVLARQNAGATNYGWIDTRTLKPVTSYPVLPGPGEHQIGGRAYHYVIPNPGGKSAYDPDTQRNFAKDECGDWIDTKTGKRVTSYPVLPGPGEHPIGGGAYHYIIPNPGGKSAYDPDTGRNFAREPCPPK